MRQPRQIDQALVDAYMARRALDYLVGFTLSPVLWRKLPGARSAGRVQSVALRLVCDRELEIEKFVAARILVARRDAGDEGRRRLRGAARRRRRPQDRAARHRHGRGGGGLPPRPRACDLRASPKVEAKPAKRHPYAPFTTSTLQQEASRKLGLAPARPCASRSASTRASTSAARPSASSPTCAPTASTWRPRRSRRHAASSPRNTASATSPASRAGTRTRPRTRRKRTRRSARPTWAACPPTSAGISSPSRRKLYELIWNRTVASQMESAELERTTVDIAARVGPRNLDLRATGQVSSSTAS